MDVENKECTFTWANNKNGEASVKKKLGKILYNFEWMALFSEAKAFALPAVGSNHNPFLLISLYPI